MAAYLYPEYIAHLSSRSEEQVWPQRAGLAGQVRPGLGIRHRIYVEGRFGEIRLPIPNG